MIADTLITVCMVLTTMLVVPWVCKKIHIPHIVGFIIVGILIGQYGFNLISDSATIQLLGRLGMLYIMLQSGIEIDINDFSLYKWRASLFGIYTFFIPLLLGIGSGLLLGFSWTTSILLGAMYGSHTLMTYPIVSRYGVQKNAAVNITIGGTMVAITLSLLTLAIITPTGQTTQETIWWITVLKIAFFIFIVIGLFPFLARYIFKRKTDVASNFILVLLMMTFSAVLSAEAGLEAILGSFVCGAALNSLIPNKSTLMERINFVGGRLLVPIFLLQVGMMTDIYVLWRGWQVVVIALVMIATKMVGKWLAAYALQRQFRLSNDERRLVFGLSHASAAGTLAVATIGFEAGIFSVEILNGAVIMILIHCTTSSFITEYAAKRIALHEEASTQSEREDYEWTLMSVGEDDIRERLKTIAVLSDLENTSLVACSDWQEASQYIDNNGQSTLIYCEKQPISTVRRLLVAIPCYAEKERDFISCFGQIRRLSSQLGARVVFFASEETQSVLKTLCQRPGKYMRSSYRELTGWEDMLMMAKEVQENDMVIMVSARRATPSYDPLFEQIPSTLEKFFTPYSYMILYPKQDAGEQYVDSLLTEGAQTSRTWGVIVAIKQKITKIIYHLQHK